LAAISTLALLGVLLAAAFAPATQARFEGFQGLASSSVPLTAVTTDPTTGLIYAQENEGKNFFAYDPRTNAWSERADAPIDSENNGGAAYLNGKIYVTYTENSAEIAVYDIGSNSWTTTPHPLGDETGNIAAGNGRLYLAVSLEFISYDPASGNVTHLADPPKFTAADCDDGFEPWGGLQVVDGKIYGHQGNGCTGFAVYDIASNSWQELPLAPEVEEEEGPVLGSAFDPLTNTYLTYGPYGNGDGGRVLYRWDIEAGSWSTSTLPFGIEDGGMAYVGLPGLEGVYMIQGEGGTEFTRYTERNVTDLSSSLSAAVAKGGLFSYSIQVRNNGPERAGGVVLTDQLPAGSALISAVPSQGTCALTTTLNCNIGALRSGASATLAVQVKARTRSVINLVTASSYAIDSAPANDGAWVASKQCVVPKLRTRRLKGAKKALRKSNCKPGKVRRRFSGKPEGKVVGAGKSRGKLLPAGSKVKLVVSRGPKDGR
jgi:uncharacterized repeat protein (TIGR01451 family)